MRGQRGVDRVCEGRDGTGGEEEEEAFGKAWGQAAWLLVVSS